MSINLYYKCCEDKWQLKLQIKNYTTYIAKSISVVSANLSIHKEQNNYTLDRGKGYLPKISILPNNWHHFTLVFKKTRDPNMQEDYFIIQQVDSSKEKLNFVVEIVFEIENNYGIKILESFWYHFVAKALDNEQEYTKYYLFNSEITYKIKEEQQND